jgi:hypothetical protein
MIVKGLLDHIRCHWRSGDEDYLISLVSILTFLEQPSHSLLSPPYPRFVGQFMKPLHQIWRCGACPDWQNGRDYIFIQQHTRLVVRVLCSWGLGFLLAEDKSHPEVIPYLIEFLTERKPIDDIVGKVFLSLATTEEFCDLSRAEAKEQTEVVAAKALLKLQWLMGENTQTKPK